MVSPLVHLDVWDCLKSRAVEGAVEPALVDLSGAGCGTWPASGVGAGRLRHRHRLATPAPGRVVRRAQRRSRAALSAERPLCSGWPRLHSRCGPKRGGGRASTAPRRLRRTGFGGRRHARWLVGAWPRWSTPVGEIRGGGYRQQRQDHLQVLRCCRARRVRYRGQPQQPHRRAAVFGADSPRRQRRLRDRHQPPRRDCAASAIGCAGCGGGAECGSGAHRALRQLGGDSGGEDSYCRWSV